MPEQLSTLLTSDGRWFNWPHSDARTTCLSGDRVLALLSRDALTRILAHEELTGSQIVALFGGSANKMRRARYLRCCAKRIREHELESLCKGIRENHLVSIFRRSNDRGELVRLLLAVAPSD